MNMKKQDLEKALEEYKQLLSQEREFRVSETEKLMKKFQESVEAKENSEYNLWKAMNGKFLFHYIQEKVIPELSVDVECGWSGSIEITLKFAGKPIASADGTVTERNNPEEE